MVLALSILASPAAAQEPAAVDARLSPDGAAVAIRVVDAEGVQLRLLTLGDALSSATPVALPGGSVGAYTWAPDGRLIVRTGDRLLAVPNVLGDPAAAPVELARNLAGPTRVVVVTRDGTAFVERPGAWPDRPDLHRVDLATAEWTRVAENDGTVTAWLVDDAGTLRGAVRAGEEGRIELVRARGDQMVPVYSCDAGDVCEALGFRADGRWWLVTSHGRGDTALVMLDPLTLEEETVRPDLSGDPTVAFRSDSLYRRDGARLREAVGAGADVTWHRSNGRARMLVTVRDAAGARLVVFDRWSGAVIPVARLANAGTRSARERTALVPDPTQLRPARLRYRVADNEVESEPIEVRRRIERRDRGGRQTWRVIDLAEVPTYGEFTIDTAALLADPNGGPELGGFDEPPEPEGMEEAADTTIFDARTLRPVTRRAGGPVEVRLDFDGTGVRGEVASAGFTTDVALDAREAVWADGAALELLVAALPLDDGYTAQFPLFQTDGLDTVTVRLDVTGAERVTTAAGAFDAWRVTIVPVSGDGARYEWMVMRDAPHYLLRGSARVNDFVTTTELTDAGDLR